jgi:hypothetical protein
MHVNFSHTAFRSPAIKLLAAIVIAFRVLAVSRFGFVFGYGHSVVVNTFPN